MKVTIMDLDATISDDRWRHYLIDETALCGLDQYHNYHLVCDQDAFINQSLVSKAQHPIVFITSRPTTMREKTQRWLSLHGIPYHALYMRPDHNDQPSPVLKSHLLWTACTELCCEPVEAYDDRADVLQAYLDMCPTLNCHEVTYE